MRIRHRPILPIIAFVFVAAGVFAFLATSRTATTEAASTANFNPGNIISDYVMSNYDSMTEQDIQDFLTSKGNCNYTETWRASSGQNDPSYFHIKDGHFVCLADEIFGDGIEYGDGVANGETAAHIIWQAAQDYQINPQVLIVLLEKEQGLITDAWPNKFQYRSATGYGCPDTAACNTKYYGFKNQVRLAAALFRTVLNGGWTNYPLGENYIQYNPDANCGGSVVNVENLATSALYRYTPYQPNSATLAAGYGTAYCGAYGNRNFYLYFSDWFGDPTIESKIPQTEPQQQTARHENLETGTYTIHSAKDTSKVMDISGGVGTAVSGTNIQIFQKNNTEAQMWKFEYNDDGYYTIINPSTDKVFDVSNAGTTNGTNIQLFAKNGTCAQKWRIEEVETDIYTFISACSDLVMEAAGGVMNSETNIQLFTSNNTEAQKWKIILIP